MMKKIMIFLLSLALLGGSVSALALDYTLPEKMDKQLASGSGLKVSFTLDVEGENATALALSPFSGQEFQIRYIRSGDDLHAYLYRPGAKDDEMKGLTECFVQSGRIFLRSDYFGNRVYSLASFQETLDQFYVSEGENPSFSSMMWNILSAIREDGEPWEILAENLSRKLEMWIMQFADTESLRGEVEGNDGIELSYTVPMAEIRKEILQLIEALSQDEAATLLKAQMTPEQQNLYLNPDLSYFYEDALASMDDLPDAVLTRKVSTLGEEISSEIMLPLIQEKWGWESLTLSSQEGRISASLTDGERVITLITDTLNWDDTFHTGSIWFVLQQSEDDQAEVTETTSRSIRLDILRDSETSTDEDARDHLTETWNFVWQPDDTYLTQAENVQTNLDADSGSLALQLHYFSKYSQSSPTTLEMTALLETGNLKLSLSGTAKTASPWTFNPFTISDPIDFLKLTGEEKLAVGMQWLASFTEEVAAERAQSLRESSSFVVESTPETESTSGEDQP